MQLQATHCNCKRPGIYPVFYMYPDKVSAIASHKHVKIDIFKLKVGMGQLVINKIITFLSSISGVLLCNVPLGLKYVHNNRFFTITEFTNRSENVQFLMGVAQGIPSCVHYKRRFIISRGHNNESLL